MPGGPTLPSWGRAGAFDAIDGEVAIAGVGDSDHTRASGRTHQQIGAEAIERALADAGLDPEDVDGLLYSGGMGAEFGEVDFHAHFGTRQRILTDPHSAEEFRVNGVVRNIDAWYRAFNVQPGDRLYLPPEQRVHIW